MTPVTAHAAIDRLGVLDDAHSGGTYSLEVETPDAVDDVQRQWLDAIDAPLPDDMAEQLADAETTLYVGRSQDVYGRVMDHARGKVRRASFLRAFRLVDVRGVWTDDANTGVAERDRARALSDGTTLCYTDGELF